MKLFFIIFIYLISINSYSKRIISTYPAATEMIYSLGLESKLVGVSNYCRKIKGVAQIGSAITPNLEMIVGLKPDVVLIPEINDSKKIIQTLSEFNIKKITLRIDRLQDIFDSLKILGEELKVDKKAVEISKKLQSYLDVSLKFKYERILIVLSIVHDANNGGIKSLNVAGSETFYDDILKKINLRNSWKQNGYSSVNFEKLQKLKIDRVIIFTSEESANKDYKVLKKINTKIKKIEVISGLNYLIPGPNIIEDLINLLKRDRDIK